MTNSASTLRAKGVELLRVVKDRYKPLNLCSPTMNTSPTSREIPTSPRTEVRP